MKQALSWCLQHTVVLVIVLFILVGIIYRQAIFGLGVDDKSAEAAPAGDVAVELSTIQEMKPGSIPEDPVVSSAVDTITDAADTRGPAETVDADKIMISEAPVTDVEPPQEAAAVELPSAIVEDASGFNYRPSVEPVSDGSGDDTSQISIEQARQAYWSGNESAAIDLYRDVIRADAANPGAHGELGNILLKQGRMDDAFAEFELAVMLYKSAGNNDGADELLNALEQVDQQRSETIRSKIEENDGSLANDSKPSKIMSEER
ncbi:MAG: hypothetical protein ABW162_14345 [Candidatus Sedimenticola sp. PURPLELP]